MTAPTTVAGRAHWALHAESRVSLSDILAIEAEARAAALDEARAAMNPEELPDPSGINDPEDHWVRIVDVLAAIDALREGQPIAEKG